MLPQRWPLERARRVIAGLPLLIAAAPVVLAVRLLLYVVPFRVLVRWLDRAQPSSPRRHDGTRVARIGWAVRVVSRAVPRASCLTQAIAASTLLIAAGYPAELHLGVTRNSEQRFEAHAWLLSGGRPVVGTEAAGDFTPLARFN